jgi:hypothetical protein
VYDRKNRERITEWAVYYVPQIEYLLRPLKKKNSLGQARLAARNCDSPFEFEIRGLAQSEEGEQP